MEISEGTVRVNSSFSAKVPGQAPYSSLDKSAGISIEFPISETADLEQIIDKALQVEARLHTNVALAVAAHLGLEVGEDGLPVIPVPEEAVKPKAHFRGPNKSGYSGGGGYKPKSNGGSAPKEVVVEGITLRIWDNRDSKTGRQPDFKLADDAFDLGLSKGDGIWLDAKKPDEKALALAVLEAVGG